MIPLFFNHIVVKIHKYIVFNVCCIHPRNKQMIIAFLKMNNLVKHNIQKWYFFLLLLSHNPDGTIISEKSDKLKIDLINIFESQPKPSTVDPNAVCFYFVDKLFMLLYLLDFLQIKLIFSIFVIVQLIIFLWMSIYFTLWIWYFVASFHLKLLDVLGF